MEDSYEYDHTQFVIKEVSRAFDTSEKWALMKRSKTLSYSICLHRKCIYLSFHKRVKNVHSFSIEHVRLKICWLTGW